MRPITETEIKNAWALMIDRIKQELMNKAVNSAINEDMEWPIYPDARYTLSHVSSSWGYLGRG